MTLLVAWLPLACQPVRCRLLPCCYATAICGEMGHARRGHSAQAAAAHGAPAHLSTWGCPRVRRCLDRWLSPAIAFTMVTKRSHREKHPLEKHLGEAAAWRA